MSLVWHKGLGKASVKERLVIMKAERIARERAFGEAYQARLDALDSLLADSGDLAVRATRVLWARHKRNLYLRIFVYHRSAGRLRVFNWRCPMSGSIPL